MNRDVCRGFAVCCALAWSLAAGFVGVWAADPPADNPVPPPASPAKLSEADLEKLVAPLALFPDPLIATMLPASVYPLEIVQAARFVADTNNLARLDEQPWDTSVKNVARIPAAIQKMNDDIAWTMQLGEAFLAQDKDLMNAIQSMRAKAQKAGNLKTTPQQVVIVTNMVVETTVEQKVVVVTNTVVQIQPSNPQVVYVPTYPPTVYYPPPVYDPAAALITFTAGVAMGAIIANNCDWYHGGCYHGDVDINVDRTTTINRGSGSTTVSRSGSASASSQSAAGGTRTGATATQQKWQPDQSRLSKSGTPTTSAAARGTAARGWGSTGAASASPARPTGGTAAVRPSTGTATASRPSTPSVGDISDAPSGGARPASGATPSASRPAGGAGGDAFGGVSQGSSARSASDRGASSRGASARGGARRR